MRIREINNHQRQPIIIDQNEIEELERKRLIQQRYEYEYQQYAAQKRLRKSQKQQIREQILREQAIKRQRQEVIEELKEEEYAQRKENEIDDDNSAARFYSVCLPIIIIVVGFFVIIFGPGMLGISNDGILLFKLGGFVVSFCYFMILPAFYKPDEFAEIERETEVESGY